MLPIERSKEALPDFAQLSDDLDVKFYTFDAALAPVDLAADKFDLGPIPDGRETAIGAAMEDALRREAGHRVAGVMLLSDGAQNALYPRDESPQTAVRRLADLGVPLLHRSLSARKSVDARPDVAVTGLDVSPSVYVKNELTIRGTVRISGYRQQGRAGAGCCSRPSRARQLEVVGSTTAAGRRATAKKFRSNSATFRKRPANGK